MIQKENSGENVKRKDFIQKASIYYTLHPKMPDANTAITWAEMMWDHLTKRGYGDSKQNKPREAGKNYYNLLTAYQKEWFDKFWNAFTDKQDRNGAAMIWYRMGELSKEEYEHIVYAAGEFAKKRPELIEKNITPIMPQGWLNKRRYDDYKRKKEERSSIEADEKREKIIELRSEIHHFRALPGEFPKKEAARLTKELKKIENS